MRLFEFASKVALHPWRLAFAHLPAPYTGNLPTGSQPRRRSVDYRMIRRMACQTRRDHLWSFVPSGITWTEVDANSRSGQVSRVRCRCASQVGTPPTAADAMARRMPRVGKRAGSAAACASPSARRKPESGRRDSARRLPPTRSRCTNQRRRFLPRDACRREPARRRPGGRHRARASVAFPAQRPRALRGRLPADDVVA